MIQLKDVKFILKNFLPNEEIIGCEAFGEGHINNTYLLITKTNKKYILQKINNLVFPNVDGLMNNIQLVTNFIKDKIKQSGGDYRRSTLNFLKTTDNKNYFIFNNGYYRVCDFIDNSLAYQIVRNEEDFYNSAKSFGNFYKLLDGFDASKLVEVIPNFHNTLKRYNDFLKSVDTDKFNRVKTCLKEIQFIKDRERYYSQLVDKLANGTLPLKVTHNDTKLNNILFDKDSNKPLAVIDLDTIMPGTIVYDFGDSIRFGCNPCLEDEKDLGKVNFQFNLYKVYVKGFLEALGSSITKNEKDNLALGAIMMTIECGMRFLADYLDGDIYFHINRDAQNLDRARTQIKLVEDMEKAFDKMNALVK